MKLILLFVFLFSTHVSAKNNENWQGTYFPHGCIDCENNYVYCPTFKSFGECKKWAKNEE